MNPTEKALNTELFRQGTEKIDELRADKAKLLETLKEVHAALSNLRAQGQAKNYHFSNDTVNNTTYALVISEKVIAEMAK